MRSVKVYAMNELVSANVVDNFRLSSLDYPDDKSWAVEVYICGCDFSCENCSNIDLRQYNYQENTHIYAIPNLISKIREVCRINETNKIVLLGGDPLAKLNRAFTKEFLKNIGIEYEVCVYTGCAKEEAQLLDLKGFTFIKCGTFCKQLQQVSIKTEEYLQFASTNQELYDSNWKLLTINGRYYFKGDNK